MPFPLSTAGLARSSGERPRRVFLTWFVILILAGIAATGLADALTNEFNPTNNPESLQAEDLLEDRLRGPRPVTETVVVHSAALTVDDPQFQEVVAGTVAALADDAEIVAQVTDPLQAVAAGTVPEPSVFSADRRTVIVPVTLAGELEDAEENTDAYLDIIESQSTAEIEVLTVGDISGNDMFNRTAEEDLIKGEAIGLVAAMIVLVIVFGALVAAVLPLSLALISIFVAIGLTAVVGRFMDLSFFIVNMITMIGLAVGIDYSLFVVERYREERRHGRNRYTALEVTGGTASKAIVFSGGTVVLALIGLFMIPTVIFRSLGAGAILVVLVAVVATLTLIPALIGVLGDRINWPRKQEYTERAAMVQAERDREMIHAGVWGRITRLVMARPVISVLLAAGLLIALAIPFVDMETGASGIATLPESDVKRAYMLLAADFSEGLIAPVEVVIDAPRTELVEAEVTQFLETIATQPVFGPPLPPQWNEAGDLALIQVPLRIEGSSPAASEAILALRNEVLPSIFEESGARTLVGGGPALNVDFNDILGFWTPVVFAFVLGLSFILLTIAFRSIVVPTKAILMNLLSVGATYGMLVLVFQKGYGTGLLGFQQTPVIENWVPIFLFCVLFGLSMDYHVFLLSRIREHYDLTHRNTESVAVGLQSTGKIITGAAAIMIAVFSGFASGQLVMFQQVGFGLAVAVFLDATVVRVILVPSAMALLGDRNWYLPIWLAWLPDLRVEGSPHPAAVSDDANR
jgi:putative drug exporter of the RND superfamily